MRVIFLDRDGVINKYPGDKKYVTSLKKFKFLPNVKKAIAVLTKKGFKVFVISNQAGVGKGEYSKRTLDAITKRLYAEINKSEGSIEAVYYCTHRPEEKCTCRKPKTGLIEKVKKHYPFDLKKTYFLGDSIGDVKTAKAAGLKSILLLSGREKESNQDKWKMSPDFIFPNLWEAVKFILKAEI